MSFLLIFNLIFLILFISFGGFYFGRTNVYIITLWSLFFLVLINFSLFFDIILASNILYFYLWNWIHLGTYNITFSLLFDSLSCIMIFVIIFISFFVNVYSVGYLEYDPYLIRFLLFLSFFSFFMLTLVTASNYLQMFLGWEGVGLCSYLLINFWYTRVLANKAALKAMVVNRIADVLLILGVVLILLLFHTTEYNVVFELAELYKEIYTTDTIFFNMYLNIIDLVCFFLFIGAVGKSAQIGLHTWLPDAMEGPTPVSSLLHAATMVTAGVFLLIRSSRLLEMSALVRTLINIVGGLTTIFAGLVGMTPFDIKKVIAYSTCSQLGYMFFSCGLSAYSAAIFHLFNHAFFKALLFLSAGSVIHALGDEQDIRRMGALTRLLPFTLIAFILGSLAIMGIPYFSGFYSKDLIIELAYSRIMIDSNFTWLIGISGAILTTIYSIRLLFNVFYLANNSFYVSLKGAHDSVSFMFTSMYVLFFCSVFVGFLCAEIFVGWGNPFWFNSLALDFHNNNMIESHFYMDTFDKHIPFMLTIWVTLITVSAMSDHDYFDWYNLPFVFSFRAMLEWLDMYASFEPIYQDHSIYKTGWGFLLNAGFANNLFNMLLKSIFSVSYVFLNKLLDRTWFDLAFFNYKFFYSINSKLKNTFTELLFYYIFYMNLGLCIILFVSFFVKIWLLISNLLVFLYVRYGS